MINTVDIPESKGSSIPKTLQPGNVIFQVHSMKLDSPPYDREALNLSLSVESEKIEGFEGFFIDKNNETLGRHNGQVGNIRISQYPFKDAVTKSGVEIKRDLELMKSIKNFCNVINANEWLTSQNNKHDTFESLINQFNIDKPFANKWIRACVGGSEYVNKGGYTNYDLYIPKATGMVVSMENANVSEEESKVMKFDSEKHLRRKKVDEVKSFGDSTITSASVGSDFEL
jgi:hypothetical protein